VDGRYILTDYLASALSRGNYERLEDGSYAGTIRECPGVVAFGADLGSCQDELRSALEDWVLVGLKLGHTIPAIAGIDLNRAPSHAPVDAL
jgi:predicted RNase H-like HicB family nuclease